MSQYFKIYKKMKKEIDYLIYFISKMILSKKSFLVNKKN